MRLLNNYDELYTTLKEVNNYFEYDHEEGNKLLFKEMHGFLFSTNQKDILKKGYHHFAPDSFIADFYQILDCSISNQTHLFKRVLMRFNQGLELEDEFETNYYFRAPWHQNEYED